MNSFIMFAVWLILAFVGSVFSDGKSGCGESEFPCSDGTCIMKYMWCDTELDCNDKSDEMYCFWTSKVGSNPNNCSEGFFLCKDGPCIPLVGRCDGYHSCHDDSDEEGCGTTEANGTTGANVTTFLSTDVQTTTESTQQNATEVPTTTRHSVESTKAAMELSYPNDHENFQADSSSKTKFVNIHVGFTALNSQEFRKERLKAQQWFLKVRDQDFGWGDETKRAVTALYMSDDGSLQNDVREKLLMSKQLHLKLFTALIRNQTTEISLSDLALFINALSASCENPRNFYGQDLVGALRQRTNFAQKTSTFVTPFSYITLCLNDETTHTDRTEILAISRKTEEIDIAALTSLAATCISRNPKFSNFGKDIAGWLYRKIVAAGLPDNIYGLALVAQALNEAKINQSLWNRSVAMNFVRDSQDSDGSFGDILSTYYAVPLLSGKSILSLGEHCNQGKDNGLAPLEVLKDVKGEKMFVRYTLRFGEPVDVSQTLMMRVGKSTNLLDIMRMAETLNPVYKFKYDMSRGKPTVYSIGGVVNDAERGMYWKLLVSNSTNSTMEPYGEDIRRYIPKSEHSIVFWIKPLH